MININFAYLGLEHVEIFIFKTEKTYKVYSFEGLYKSYLLFKLINSCSNLDKSFGDIKINTEF